MVSVDVDQNRFQIKCYELFNLALNYVNHMLSASLIAQASLDMIGYILDANILKFSQCQKETECVTC